MRGATAERPEFDSIVVISIHAPHAGRDTLNGTCSQDVYIFQSTRPMRGATLILAWTSAIITHFNPRAPCGARPGGMLTSSTVGIFQSTRPMRGATSEVAELTKSETISIHAPHAGRD